ncbi:hypothetical protein RSK20926_05137 [Roseobacter sp. SK209-2-6]|nr:hypothetical protein RSK20926_05137 [Roseobacter sp. SK209-2-6]
MALWPFASIAGPFPIPPLPPPKGALSTYHLGHSLVGPDVPHMLAQLAPNGHRWNAQRGSGTSLRAHWEPEEEILHFEISNPAPAYRDAREAVGSGEYDVIVLTEMVELRDALKYFDGAKYLRYWADLARKANPETRIYLYETWHHLNDPTGWERRIQQDLDSLWLGGLLGPDSRRNPRRPVYLIPAGQVMAAVVQAIEAGKIEGLVTREDLFARTPEGEVDTIHINDLGAYLVALTHFAVIYQLSPVGLPHQLTRADGSPAQAFSAPAANEIQKLVWQVVQAQPRTGLASVSASEGAQE